MNGVVLFRKGLSAVDAAALRATTGRGRGRGRGARLTESLGFNTHAGGTLLLLYLFRVPSPHPSSILRGPRHNGGKFSKTMASTSSFLLESADCSPRPPFHESKLTNFDPNATKVDRANRAQEQAIRQRVSLFEAEVRDKIEAFATDPASVSHTFPHVEKSLRSIQ